MRRGDILVVGEAIGDFIPRDPQGLRYEAVLGGSGFNAALALARFGARPTYAACLSTDALGRRFRAALTAEGIGTALIRDSARPTAVAIVAPLGPDGVPAYGLYLEGTAHAEPHGTPDRCPPGTRHVHAASFGATIGPSGEASLALMADARAAGASISYDINIRPSVLPDRETTLALVERRIALCDIVKVSLEDLDWLCPGQSADDVSLAWRARGAGTVLVSMGQDGAVCDGPDGIFGLPSPSVTIADTVGAGDTFIGGFLAMLAVRGRLGRGFHEVSRDDLAAALDFACAVAADSCTRPGCDPPRRIAV